MPDNVDTLHDTVAAAYDEVEKAAAASDPAPAPEPTPAHEPVREETPPASEDAPADGPARDEHGRFAPAKKDAAVPVKPPEVKPVAPVVPPVVPVKPPEVKPVAPVVPPDPAVRAPQAWKALAREHWAKVPSEVQQELLRREREVNQRLAQGAEHRSFYEQFHNMVKPYEPLLAADGSNPLQTAASLFQTAAALRTGAPWQRAQVAANIVRAYGVDIDMLAQALDGAPAPAGQQAQAGMRDPRVDQLIAERERERQQAAYRQQQEEARAAAEYQARYAQFAETHEFFEDVREDMAMLVVLKGRQGVDIDDEEAYKMAVNLHPELVEIQRQREELAAATNPNGSTARSAAAAVSLKPGTASGAPKTADNSDLRAVLDEEYDRAMGR